MFANPQAHGDRESHIAGAESRQFHDCDVLHDDAHGNDLHMEAWFFVSVGVLFPIGFIHQVMVTRGSMGIPIEEMIAGRTPFCFLPTPLLILPAAFTRTIIFPGSILPGKGMAGGGIAVMIGIWLAITLVIGKGWCSYACFLAESRRVWRRSLNAQGFAISIRAGTICLGRCCWQWRCCRWRFLSPLIACGCVHSRRFQNMWLQETR